MKKLILLLSLSVGLTGCDWFSGDDEKEGDYLFNNQTSATFSVYITGESIAIATITKGGCEAITLSEDQKKSIKEGKTFDFLFDSGEKGGQRACANCKAVNANSSIVTSYTLKGESVEDALVSQSKPDKFICSK